jgi:hypothetical protein
MITTTLQQLIVFIAPLVVQVYSGERGVKRCALVTQAEVLLVSQVQAVSFYLVRCVGVLSVIGQNKLFCDWSE